MGERKKCAAIRRKMENLFSIYTFGALPFCLAFCCPNAFGHKQTNCVNWKTKWQWSKTQRKIHAHTQKYRLYMFGGIWTEMVRRVLYNYRVWMAWATLNNLNILFCCIIACRAAVQKVERFSSFHIIILCADFVLCFFLSIIIILNPAFLFTFVVVVADVFSPAICSSSPFIVFLLLFFLFSSPFYFEML